MHTTELLTTLHDALVGWLVHGLADLSGWQIVAYTLVTTHITIAAVTIFLHRTDRKGVQKDHGAVAWIERFRSSDLTALRSMALACAVWWSLEPVTLGRAAIGTGSFVDRKPGPARGRHNRC